MKPLVALGLIGFIVAAFSGCVFDSDDKDAVKRGSVSGTVKTIFTGEAVEGVKILLVNRDSFVDSAVTGADGSFHIDEIAPGNYCVVAVRSGEDDAPAYKFTLAQSSDPYEFTLNGDARTVHFIAEQINVPGASSDRFTIELIFKLSNYLDSDRIRVYRRLWVWLIPGWCYEGSCDRMLADDGKIKFEISATYGYTCLAYTWDNYFQVNFTADGQLELGFGISNAPPHSKFEYDLATRSLTRLE